MILDKKFINPSCFKCINYLFPRIGTEDFNKFGKCAMFKSINIINNKIYYEYANLCRSDHKKCGLEAKHFKPHDYDSF